MIKNELVVVGGGLAGRMLIQQLRCEDASCNIRLIDRARYSFDKDNYCSDLIGSSRIKGVSLSDFASQYNVDFLLRNVERVQLNKNLLYCKGEEPIGYKTVAFACGLKSKPLSIKGEFRDGVCYLDEQDLFSLKDILKISHDIVILAHTLLGLRLAFACSFLQKEIKLFTGSLDFLSSYPQEKEYIMNILSDRKVDMYENVLIEEIIGEACVKAVKTSIPKVFSSQAVLIDSGFTSIHKLLELSPKENTFSTDFPDVYILGDMADTAVESESFFFARRPHIELAGQRCARLFLTGEPQEKPSISQDSLLIKKCIKNEFNVERMTSLV